MIYLRGIFTERKSMNEKREQLQKAVKIGSICVGTYRMLYFQKSSERSHTAHA